MRDGRKTVLSAAIAGEGFYINNQRTPESFNSCSGVFLQRAGLFIIYDIPYPAKERDKWAFVF